MQDLPNKSFIVNRINGKGCEVQLNFTLVSSSRGKEEFTIIRKIAPQSLKVIKNGVDKTKSTIPESNTYIKKVLSATPEIFSNCIIMRANNTIPFMNKRKAEKKSFIETVFNLSVFSDMLKLLKEDVRNTRNDYNIENNLKSQLESTSTSYNIKLDQIEQEVNEYNSKLETITLELKQKIESEETNNNVLKEASNKCAKVNFNDKLEELTTASSTISSNLRKLTSYKSQFNTEINIKKRNIKELSTSKVCPTCGQSIDSKDHEHDIESEIIKLNSDITELESKLTKINEKENEVNQKNKETSDELANIRSKIRKCEMIQQNLIASGRLLESYGNQLEQLQERSSEERKKPILDLLNDISVQLEDKKSIVDKFEKKLGKLNICEHVLGDFGVRAFVVNKLLALFNSRIAYYLSSFKSTFKFTFNEYFEEEIKDSNEMICSYNNCSGAEMKKIDLAITMAFNDILKYQQGIEYNVSFYDEILDSSLDTKSLEIVVDFIASEAKVNNKAVYIITHKQDLQLPEITETILLEKSNGFTKRV